MPHPRATEPTARGWEMLELACREGLTLHGVAIRLGISRHTVKSTLQTVYRRLGAANIANACYILGVREARIGWKPDVPASRADDV
jgi:DNA-binding NarL/FixJ family response regulator